MKFIKTELGIFTQEVKQDSLSYPESGNDDCYAMEDNSQWFQARNQTLSSMMKKYPFDGDFIDIGGGNGYQVNYLRKQGIINGKWILCEPGMSGCINAVSRGVEDVYNCSYEDFPFSDFNIGAVGLFDVIEHIKDPISFLKGIIDRVAVGTKIYITVPALQSLWSEVDVISGHFKRYNYQDVGELESKLSVKLQYRSYFFSYYVPFLFGLRVFPEKLGFRQTHEQIGKSEKSNHKANLTVNGILNWLHRKELSKMVRGENLNFGTSMLLVFIKE